MAEIERLRARARRAEAALGRVHREQEDAPWFVSGNGQADGHCPYRDLIDNLHALVVFVDGSGTICHANCYTAEFLGLDRDELEGMSARDVLHSIVAPGPDHDQTVNDLLADPDVPRVDEIDVVLPDGSDGCVSLARRPVYGPDGELLGVVAIGTDVTARRRALHRSEIYQEALRSLTSELALTEERQRRTFAVRIHEEISQNLAYAKLRVSALKACAEDAGCMRAIGEINDLLDDAIEGTRALAFEISPPMLHELGFSEAVEWLAEQFEDRHDITCQVLDERSNRELPAETSVTLFRAVAELLSNIAEHSGADSASIEIGNQNGAVQVRVSDDGRGFNPDAVFENLQPQSGCGLFNIRERLRHLGGELAVDSTPLVGTQVTLNAPIRSRAS
ncbi:MAG: ATP-binding protein [Armatimonadota bacterium]